MKQDIMSACMNPARQRILQVLALRQSATPGQLSEALPDIPRASLYRHLRILQEAKMIEVCEEKAIRGTVERSYALKQGQNPQGDNVQALIQGALAELSSRFSAYFAKPNADPVRDMLTLSCATLLLTDEEYENLLRSIGTIYADALENQMKPGRKQRSLTFISIPVAEEGEES